MNVVNRLVMVLLIVLALLCIAVLAVAPRQALEGAASFFSRLSSNVQALNDQPTWPLFATARVVGGSFLAVAALLVLWLELRRPRKRIIRAQKLAGGESFLTVDSINQRLAYSIDQLPDVVSVAPRVQGYGRGGLDLELLVETAPEIEVPMKTEEILQVTKEIVTQRMGLKLGKVQVKIKHAPYPKV